MRERILGGPNPTVEPPAAAATVSLIEFTDLARLVVKMLDAQRDYFDLRKRQPHVNHKEAYQRCRYLEGSVRRAAQSALAREQVSLPGMECDPPADF